MKFLISLARRDMLMVTYIAKTADGLGSSVEKNGPNTMHGFVGRKTMTTFF